MKSYFPDLCQSFLKSLKAKYAAAALLLAAVMTGGVQAQTTQEPLNRTLDGYFQLMAQAPSPTDPSIFKEANAYWLKGIQGNHVSVARFFLLHAADNWVFEKKQSAGDYAAIEVHFNTATYNKPWRTRFELAKVGSDWKITDYEDLTIRPFDDSNAGPGELVEAYLNTMQAVIQDNQKFNPNNEQHRTRFYQSGAGFWSGTAIRALPLYLWLKQQNPQQPVIDSVVEQESGNTVTVRFARTKRQDQPVFIKLTVAKEQRRLYITSYENVAVSEQQAELAKIKAEAIEAVTATTVSTLTAEDLVRSQLEILQQAGPGMAQVMSQVIELSEPLWVSSKMARASLGRLIAIFTGLASSSANPEWKFESSGTTIIARPVNADQLGAFSALLKGIEFTHVQQEGAWKLSSATAFR